jgi:two-component system, OmpR family, response regulator MprA
MKTSESGLQPLRILCAEDNVHVASVLLTTLRQRGYCVEPAVDGQQALDTIATAPAALDLLITDFRMPRLNGYELAKQARDRGFTGKIIIFASPVGDEDRQRLLDLPVDAIFEKPASQKDLLARIKAIDDARRTTA